MESHSVCQWERFLTEGNTVDETTRARINLNGVLRALEQLPALDPQTALSVAGTRETIQFSAPGVATVRLVIGGGGIGHFVGAGPATIKLFFPRPAMVNKMFDGTGNPIPVKGFSRLGYLTGPFTHITDRLSYYLRPTAELLADPDYRTANSTLTLYLAVYAMAEIGNGDVAGREVASHMADGDIQLAVKAGPALTLSCRNHRLQVKPGVAKNWRAKMIFADLESAGEVLRGELASYTAIGRGLIELGGYVPLLDNMNKLLGLVPRYLA